MQETWVQPWVGKLLWSRAWQCAPVFLLGKFYAQRSLEGYSPWGCKESDMTEQLAHTHTHTHPHTQIEFLLLFICSVMSNYLWSYVLQHARLPCPSLSPAACSNSCPLSRWCHPTISPSVTPFSFCLQSLPVSGSFLMSQPSQSIGASASASVLPMNSQSWFPLGLTGLISLQSKGLSRVFSKRAVRSHKYQSQAFSSLKNFYLINNETEMSVERDLALRNHFVPGKITLWCNYSQGQCLVNGDMGSVADIFFVDT